MRVIGPAICGTDATCSSGCKVDHAEGLAKWAAVQTCKTSNCSTECSSVDDAGSNADAAADAAPDGRVKALVALLVVLAAGCASSGLRAQFAGRTEPLTPGAAEYCDHCPGELVSVSLRGSDVVLGLDLEAVCYSKPHDVAIRGAEGEAHAVLTYAGKSVEGRDGVVHIETCDPEHLVGRIRAEFEDGSRVEGDLNVTITKQSSGYM